MLKNVLAAVDGSPDSLVALRYAAEIAQACGAAVRALFVKDAKILESGALALVKDEPAVAGAIEAAIQEEAQQALGRARDLCGRLGVPLETEVKKGVVPLVLLDEARDQDLLAMGRWGEHALWNTGLLGSAVECVVRKVQKPVLVCSGAYRAPRRLVAAYDGSLHARTAHRLAGEVAAKQKLPLAVLHVSRDRGRQGDEVLAQAAQEIETLAARGLAPAAPPERLHHRGEPAAEIAAEADAGTLTFMGAFGHSPMRELILGSVTEQVMRAARGPVILCR